VGQKRLQRICRCFFTPYMAPYTEGQIPEAPYTEGFPPWDKNRYKSTKKLLKSYKSTKKFIQAKIKKQKFIQAVLIK